MKNTSYLGKFGELSENYLRSRKSRGTKRKNTLKSEKSRGIEWKIPVVMEKSGDWREIPKVREH